MAQDLTNVPCIVIELVDTGTSGWVQEGTQRSANPQVLSSPEIRFIPNKGYRAKKIPILDSKNEPVMADVEEEYMNDEGEIKVRKVKKPSFKVENERIRFINNSRTISVKEQEAAGILPAPSGSSEDMIGISWGERTVWQTGNTYGLYDFLNDVYFNESNPDRPEHVTALFRVRKLAEETEEQLDSDDYLFEGLEYMSSLKKKEKGKTTYNDQRIELLCQMFSVSGLNAPDKLKQLNLRLKAHPKHFVTRLRKVLQGVQLEIRQALELDVIAFEGNAAAYKAQNKIILNMGAGRISQDEKIEKLAAFFQTTEGLTEYETFKKFLREAKDLQLKNS